MPGGLAGGAGRPGAARWTNVPLLDSGMALERELKFSVLDPRVPALVELEAALSASGFRATSAPEQDVHDHYFDDDAGSLHAAGVALRRRRQGDEAWAGIKAGGEQDGALHVREELEVAMASAALDAPWPDAILERLAGIVEPEALVPKVELETHRVCFLIHSGEDAVAMLSFDAVTARAPGAERDALFDEVEIEALVERTSRADLEGIAEAVDGLVRLTPNPVNKLERAEALLLLATW